MDTMRVGLHSNKLVHRAELLRFVANPIVSLMISRPNMDVQERSIDIQDGRVLLYNLKGILDIERSCIEFQVDGYENYAVFFEPGFSYLPIDREVLMNVTIEWKTKEQNHVQSKICLFQDLAKKRGNKKTALNIAAGGEEDSSRSLQGCNNKADRHDDPGSGSSNHFESQNRFRDSSLRIVPSEHAILYHIGAYLLNNSDTADTLTNIVMFLSENTKELLHHEIERTLFDYPDIFEKDIIDLNITKFQLLPFPWVKTLFKMSALELDCPFISYASETTCSIEKAFTSGNNSIILLGVRSVLTEGHLEIRFTDFTARLELPTPTQFEESRTRGYMDSYENVVLSNIQANLTQNGVVLHVMKVLIERDDDDDDELLPLLADSDGRCIITVPAENCDQDCHPDFPGMPDVQTIQNVHCLPLLKRMPVEK